MSELAAMRDAIQAWDQQGIASAVITITRVQGSSYRREGVQMLVPATGEPIGMISGGCLEGDAIEIARRVIATGVAESVTWNLQSATDGDWGLGGGCNGIIDARVEPLRGEVRDRMRNALEKVVIERTPAPQAIERENGPYAFELTPVTRVLALGGGGSDAQVLADLVRATGWEVAVLRDVDELRSGKPVIDPWTAIVVMSHHFERDAAALRVALASDSFYIGVLGPAARTDRLLEAIAQPSSHTDDRVHAPAGLDIGADTPAEIAASIISEIAATRAGRDGGHLRDRRGSLSEHAK